MTAAADIVAELEAQLGRLPRRLQDQARAELHQKAAQAVYDELMADPMRHSENLLADYYHALAGGTAGRGVNFGGEDDDAGETDTKAEIVRRIRLVHAVTDDAAAQAQVMRNAVDDPAGWFADWVWMVDPRLGDLKNIPFVPWDAQRDAIAFIEEHRLRKESCMVKKSRDFGMSVMVVGLGVLYWLTQPHSVTGYGSRKVEYVHKIGDYKSLLHKGELILRHLPAWMLPAGFSFDKHYNHMHVRNPANQAELLGEGGDELGRGARCGIFFADEFPEVQNQAASQQSLSGTTDCTVYFGTSKGPTTHFYRMEVSGAYDVLRLPWYYDPRKVDRAEDIGNPAADSRWKRGKLRELLGNLAAFNQEFACDDSAALERVVIPPEWVNAAIDLGLEPGSETVGGQDLAEEGGDESVLALRRGGVVLPLTTWTNIRLVELAPKVVAHATAAGAAWLNYDASGLGSGFEGELAKHSPPFPYHGINGQAPADKLLRYDDNMTKTARERFGNKATEVWWSLRRRFHRTYLYVHNPAPGSPDHVPEYDYPHDELISIPNDQRLIQQLSARQFYMTGTGKVQLEDKKKMSISPDRADALAYTEDLTIARQRLVNMAKTAPAVDTRKRYEW